MLLPKSLWWPISLCFHNKGTLILAPKNYSFDAANAQCRAIEGNEMFPAYRLEAAVVVVT